MGEWQNSEAGDGDAAHTGQCQADWRRPDGYWRCAREADHRGRHRMKRAAFPGPAIVAVTPLEVPGPRSLNEASRAMQLSSGKLSRS
jgi:hypothetical protein